LDDEPLPLEQPLDLLAATGPRRGFAQPAAPHCGLHEEPPACPTPERRDASAREAPVDATTPGTYRSPSGFAGRCPAALVLPGAHVALSSHCAPSQTLGAEPLPRLRYDHRRHTGSSGQPG